MGDEREDEVDSAALQALQGELTPFFDEDLGAVILERDPVEPISRDRVKRAARPRGDPRTEIDGQRLPEFSIGTPAAARAAEKRRRRRSVRKAITPGQR